MVYSNSAAWQGGPNKKTLGDLMKKLIACAALVLLCACASQSAKVNAYTEPTHTPGTIRSIAIFPVTNSSLAPGEGQRINQTIGPRIAAKNPGIRIISPAEAITKLNDAGQATVWARFLDAYTSSGIPDSSALRQISTTLGVDAIVQGSVAKAIQQDGILGVRAGGTLVTVQVSAFDARQGRLIWQASSEGRSTTATTLENAPPLAEAIQLAVDKLIENMPPL
ncbi:MAG: hypothetical protein JWM77_1507 [Rhodospirillales bacterium]|nr:hypothetical protein [Rhodospirillales bacterium]